MPVVAAHEPQEADEHSDDAEHEINVLPEFHFKTSPCRSRAFEVR